MNKLSEYQLVVRSPGGCDHCKFSSAPWVTVESIEQQAGVGWKLRGTGRVRATCPNCGAMYDAVLATIPIECASYTCPDCGGTQSLKYNVQRVEAKGSEFTFQAEITCSKCSKKKSLIETLKNVLNLRKLEVKLTGITIER